MSERKRKPEALKNVLSGMLAATGLASRVEQAAIVPEWPTLVGRQIALVTEPLHITADGILFVAVKTNAWMTELSLLEPELLRSLNAKPGRRPVVKIRWQIKRS